MRVGMIFPSKDPLGPGQWSGTPFGLRKAFEDLGAEVVPIGHFLPPGLRHAEAAVARLGGKRGPSADRAWTRVRARRLIFQRQIDAIGHVDLVLAMITDAYRLQDLRIPCPVVTYDDATFAQMWSHPDSDLANAGFSEREVRRWVATQRGSVHSASAVCVSTSWAKRSMVADYGLTDERVHVVGMGHRPRTPGGDRDWSRPTYLFVGVDWRRKNGQRVLDAFARVRADVPEAELHLVGRHDPVDAPGVVDHGHLRKEDAGAQALLDELFARATAFVLPSLLDPSPIAYLEAASAGLPVVATTQGGAGELLGASCLTVDPWDDEAVYGAMRRLADPAQARLLGERAAEAARRSSWSEVARRIIAVGLAGDPQSLVMGERP